MVLVSLHSDSTPSIVHCCRTDRRGERHQAEQQQQQHSYRFIVLDLQFFVFTLFKCFYAYELPFDSLTLIITNAYINRMLNRSFSFSFDISIARTHVSQRASECESVRVRKTLLPIRFLHSGKPPRSVHLTLTAHTDKMKTNCMVIISNFILVCIFLLNVVAVCLCLCV